MPASTLDALMVAAEAVLTADSLQDTLLCVAERLEHLVPFEDLTIYEVDRGAGMFVPLFAHGSYTDEVMAHSFPLSQGVTGATLRSGEPRNVPRTDLDPVAGLVAGTAAAPEAMMCVPLKVAGEAIAMLNVYRPGESAAFSPEEARVIERFGIIVALALDSARQRELLRAQAETDDLTGLLNRRAFNQRLDALLHEARRAGRPLSLVIADLDHFKRINDENGHHTGDAALVAVAESLKGVIRGDDLVARIGGEEFALVLPDADVAAAVAVAERARVAVATDAYLALPLTISAGVASYPAHASQPEELLRAADDALYAAKRAGRDRVHVST